VDIIAVVGNQRVAIQCKNYKKPVGNRPVQEVYTGARHHGCQQKWVVAPAGFTKGAVDLARSVGVVLFDANSIRAGIQQADQRASEQEQEAIHPTA
jgi:restriction system protein